MKKAIFALILLLAACTPRHARVCPESPRFTLGKAQLYLYEGMSGSEVVSLLGSPNIVTKDKEGRETWVYDKVASRRESQSHGYSFFLFGGATSQTTASQETVTVAIKFNESHCIEEITYHASSF